ncbi:hypothetical protein Tco_1482932 [Tanacetum coccineum]
MPHSTPVLVLGSNDFDCWLGLLLVAWELVAYSWSEMGTEIYAYREVRAKPYLSISNIGRYSDGGSARITLAIMALLQSKTRCACWAMSSRDEQSQMLNPSLCISSFTDASLETNCSATRKRLLDMVVRIAYMDI